MKKLQLLVLVGLVLLFFSNIFAQAVERKVVQVPKVDAGAITIDGVMDEAAWGEAATADMITDIGFEIWTNKYYRESLIEPDYDEMRGYMLWSEDSLYVFMHIDEFVDDSTDLFWQGQWTGDQLFISISSRLGEDMMQWYDGNVYRAPEGPYHFWILGDDVSLTLGNELYVPEEFRCNYADSLVSFDASSVARWATSITKETGVWDVEMAIYNPHIANQSQVGFNIGGSTGSSQAHEQYGDAYAYFCWQPNVPNDPYAIPADNDPGYYNLASSSHFAILNMVSDLESGVDLFDNPNVPAQFSLEQNYPNPFNPQTTIRFDIKDQTDVTLKVFNTLGKEVATLIADKTFSSGRYSVSWNASDLASGIYLYRLQAGGIVETKRMVLLK